MFDAPPMADAAPEARYEEEPIRYSDTPPDDRVARLKRRLAAGQATLAWDDAHGWLRAVLRALAVPVSSQVLVFSKTSLQRDRISPRTPRAIYFNDEVYVGWIPDAEVIELAAVDPRQGTIFYTLPQRGGGGARLRRGTHECLQCHDSPSMTGGVPGLMMRSVVADRTGQPLFGAGTFVTTPASPFEERWGGWYVTGKHGKQLHLGNVMAPPGEAGERDEGAPLDRPAGANVTDLAGRIAAGTYLSPGSDRNAEAHERPKAVWSQHHGTLGDVGAPIVTDENRSLDPESVEYPDQIRYCMKSAVEVCVRRSVA